MQGLYCWGFKVGTWRTREAFFFNLGVFCQKYKFGELYSSGLIFCNSVRVQTGKTTGLLKVSLDILFPLQGKLGHGDTNRVYKPKVIEGLQGLVIKKVCCGSQFSLALTSTGLVSVSSHTKMTICAVYYSLLSMLILMKFSKTTWNNWWTVEAPLLQNTNMEAYYMPSAWLDCLVALLVVIIELLKVNIKLWKWKFGWSAELFCFELIVLFERAVGVALLLEEIAFGLILLFERVVSVPLWSEESWDSGFIENL